jgi:hypothetical protein
MAPVERQLASLSQKIHKVVCGVRGVSYGEDPANHEPAPDPCLLQMANLFQRLNIATLSMESFAAQSSSQFSTQGK